MDPNRRTAVTAGIVFIAATAASLLGTAIEQPVLTGMDYLSRISADPTRISTGGLLELIAAGTSAGIAIVLYPVLKSWGRGLALGAVVFRAIEAVMYVLGAVNMLALHDVAQQFTQAAGADRAWLQALGDSLISVREVAILAGVFAFALGAFMYYCLFYRSRLVPRWLSGWGIVAVLLMLVACLLALFSGNPVSSYVVLILPIAVQEMVLAVWLIARGFSSATLRARTVASESAA
ncbi:MAG: DUF4386 domain-containing protein [Chloroflexia bacterium]